MSKTLIAESIAELKELKRVTIENAKLEFAESITPQIRAILESSLAEEAEAEDEKDEIEEAKKEGEEAEEKEEAPAEDKDEEAPKGEEESEEEVDETFDIDAALAEIEGSLAESDDEDKDDAPAEDEEAMKEAEEAPENDVEVEGGEADELDEDYINKLLAEVEDEEAGEEEMNEEASEEDEVIDVKEVEGADKKDEQLGLIGKAAEVLKKVFPNLDAEAAKKFEKDLRAALDNATGLREEEDEKEEMKEEEASEEEVTEQELLESLKKEAKELNLLNSKLLFQNKLLLEGTFNDQQKANIIKALDKAKTVNEAKIVYETYKNMTTGKKAPQPKVSEQLGFRKIGVLQESYQPKTSYDPTDPVVLELQRRAGIRK